MNKYGAVVFIATLLVSRLALANEQEGANCDKARADMLKTGIAYDYQITINRPVDKVWQGLQHARQWDKVLAASKVDRIKGTKGEAGELIKITVTEGAQPFFAEAIAVRPNKNKVWKIFPSEGCDAYSFFDTALIDLDGKTLLHKSYYVQANWLKPDYKELREMIAQGEIPDYVKQSSLALKAYVESQP